MKQLTLTPLDLQLIKRALSYTKWTDCEKLHSNLKKLLQHGRDNHESVDCVVMEWKNTKPKGA